MIASVRGQCLQLTSEQVVLEVGGVGLLLTCTPKALAAARVGAECRLATALIVREDGWTLFGFVDEDERRLFELLQSVSGVGPRLAVAAVGALGAGGLAAAIGAADSAALTRIPGVGKKTAERIVLELRDKVADVQPVGASTAGVPGPAASSGAWQHQVAEGLVSLGWQQRDADEAVRLVAADIVAEGLDPTDVGALLKRALKRLDRV
ncbi:MAG: hypothetical protein RLZ55_1282 [Actinomycetota bacterium]|jgi:Holliday junction DNA helicase RuvA